MKKVAAILALVILYVGWSLGGETQADSQGDAISDLALLSNAFAATSAASGRAEFHGWSVISSTYFSPREAEAAVEAMAEIFELNRNEYKIYLRSTGHYGYATMDFDLSETVRLRLQVQSLDNETVASIEVYQSNHRGLAATYQQIKQALQAVGAQEEDVKITSCLEGYFDARLRDSDKLNTVYSAFNSVEAVYQEGIDANGVTVWSGWSPLFAHSVSTGHKDVNFCIAFRWEGESKRTLVRIATPVLPGSY